VSDAPRGWTVSAAEHAAEVLQEIYKSDDQLYRGVLLFLRSAALEAGGAVTAGKKLPGLLLADGRIALDVPREPVVVYYVPDLQEREIHVTDVIWLG